MQNKAISLKLQKLIILLHKYLPLISESDTGVIRGNETAHKWITSLMKLERTELMRFDAQKQHTLLNDPDWLQLVDDMKELSSFKKVDLNKTELKTFGNLKKQHELKQLHLLMNEDNGKSITDFGGGVGNLAYFLESELDMQVTVLEKDQALIDKGKRKLSKKESKVNFNNYHICSNSRLTDLPRTEVAIGLHTCGNFAVDMFKACIKNETKKMVNFGCCYSKIKGDLYNLSTQSDKTIILNSRALSSATKSFQEVPIDFYYHRWKIIAYKLSFYHWLYKEHNYLGFVSMSNSRKNLYENSFSNYVNLCLDRYFPEMSKKANNVLESFYQSERNTYLIHYISASYALKRYLGKLVELYILCDRALFLEENGYHVDIIQVFDPKLSPRSHAIIGLRK